MEDALNILVISTKPQPDTTQLLQRYQNIANLNVIETTSGQEALAICKQQAPDYILFHHHIQDMTALDFLERCQQQGSLAQTATVLLTQSGEQHITHAIKPEVFDFLLQSNLLNVPNQHLDPLTGLLEIASFERTIEGLLSSCNRHNRQLALLSIGIQNFKQLNKDYNHQLANTVLIEMAKRINKYTRNEDILARVKADNFILVLADLRDYSDAGRVAQKIYDKLCEPIHISTHQITLKANIGIACYPQTKTTTSGLMKHADEALLRSKNTDGNVYQYYSHKLQHTHTEQLALEKALASAIHKHELYLLFQPVIDVAQNKVVCLESFLRWRNTQFGHILPSQIISCAESIGLIDQIEDWIIDEVCRCYHEWRTHHTIDLDISINLSPKNFVTPNYIDNLSQKCLSMNVPNNALKLEINSTESFTQIDKLSAQIKHARGSGFEIIIDNFGSGSFSFFDFIKLLPLSAIKLSRKLAHEATKNTHNSNLMKSILDFCTDLEVPVIAVGIENYEQKKIVEEYNCKLMQGYYFYELLSAKQVDTLFYGH